MDSYEHIVDVIAAILVIFLVPLIYFGQKQDAVIQTVVQEYTRQLADDIRSKGYLTREMYDSYLGDLSATGELYDISMEHRQLIPEPEYRFCKAQEIIEEQNQAYTGENVYTYHQVTTQPPEVNDPINTGSLNTETNESVLASAVNSPASPNHVHTAECYDGHRHSNIEDNNFIHNHQHDNGCIEFVSAVYEAYDCPDCGGHVDRELLAQYCWDSAVNGRKCIYSVSGDNKCYYCGSRNISNCILLYAYGYSCGYDIDIDKDGLTDAVGTGTVYQYKKNTPQSTDKATYTSGCYRYHVHKWLNYYGEGTTNLTVDYRLGNLDYMDVMYQLSAAGGADKFCYLPSEYTIELRPSAGTQGPSSIRYRMEVLSDRTVRFKKINVTVGGYGDQTARFPDYVSYDEFIRIRTPYTMAQFLNSCMGIKAISNDSDFYLYKRYSGGVSLCNEAVCGTWQLNCGKIQDETVICNQRVISITPTHPVQTVAAGDPLITTVTVQYHDGSTRVVIADADFSTSKPVQDASVALTYNYTIAGTAYSKTCKIKVSVILRNKTCVSGHIYNLNADGSDPGCPYCRAWLKSLEIAVPSSESITIYKGTTLQDNGVVLLATYLDGRKEFLYNGYVDNLDQQYVGTQEVTISYKGKYAALTVTTKRNVRLCPVCGRYYELYPDGNDPGCPYCLSLTPIFTGNVMEYYVEKYNDEILDELYEGSDIYYFTDGDYFGITVSRNNGSWGSRLLSFFQKNLDKDSILTINGGYIREDGELLTE